MSDVVDQPTLAFEGAQRTVPEPPEERMDDLHRPLQEIFIPVWSQVRLSQAEMRVIDHPAFKRLATIYQLGQTHLVFRGATHRRWEHAVGTVQAAQEFITAIARTHEIASIKGEAELAGRWRRTEPFRPHEVVLIRMGALLHDLGHLPAGHTLEDELGLLDKHDADARMGMILGKAEWRGVALRPLGELLDEVYAGPARATMTGLPPSELLLELVSKTRGEPEHSKIPGDTPEFRINAARDVIGNTICADLLDYLHRDWHHLGKPRSMDNRLLDYFELREHLDEHRTALVVNLREGPSVRNDAVTAIFELLESRYQLGEVALFHRTKLTAAAMLERLVAEVADVAKDASWFTGQLESILECTDEELLDLLRRKGRELAEAMKQAPPRKRLEACLPIARSLRYRELHKQVLAFDSQDLGSKLGWVRETLGGAQGASQRLNDCRSLEEDFGLASGSVVMYCPARAPHAKIAQVQVLVNGGVSRLNELEEPGSLDPRLTSGILRAQLSRFDRLWRVQVSITQEARKQLKSQETFSIFLQTVEWLVLRANRNGVSVEQCARELAGMLVMNRMFDTQDLELVAAGESHARTRGYRTYGSGAPTLRSLLVRTTRQ